MSTSSLVCAAFWFVCTLTLGLLLPVGRGSLRQDVEFDVSGVGRCAQNGTAITVSEYTAFVWPVSPEPLSTATPPLRFLDFVGKNSVVMNDRAHARAIVVTTPDGNSSFVLHSAGANAVTTYDCTFTLDAAPQACFVYFQPQGCQQASGPYTAVYGDSWMSGGGGMCCDSKESCTVAYRDGTACNDVALPRPPARR